MIRTAHAGDAEGIAVLEQEVFGSHAWSPAQIGSDIASSTHTVVVAVRDGHLLGHAAIALAGDVADLTRIAVTESVRRRGVASDLLSELVTAAAHQGADRMLLEVAAANVGAQDFYLARGFTEISRRGGYYPDGDDALVLARALS